MSEVPEIFDHDKKKNYSRFFILLTAGGVFFCVGFFVLFTATKAAQTRTLPGLFIGDISVGDLEKPELKNFLRDMSTKLSADGIHFDLKENDKIHSFTLIPETVTDVAVLPSITIDTEKETNRIFALGKTGNILKDVFAFLNSKIHKQNITIENISVDKERLASDIHEQVKQYEAPPKNSRLVFTSFDPLTYSLTSSTNGYVFTISEAIESIESSWKLLQSPNVLIVSRPTSPLITEAAWANVLPSVAPALSSGPILIDKVDEKMGLEKEWKVPVSTFASWLTLSESANGTKKLSFDWTSTTQYLENKIAVDVFQEAKSAKFSIDSDGKVQEFQASQVGVGLDTTSTYQALESLLQKRINFSTSSPIQVVLRVVEPTIATGVVNDFGVKDILGFGVSNYSGSPANRIKNIRNAVRKLNGVLIKPGEEFSAIKYTQPYTLENGYLSELVIKGDKIKPEIGGGLCQVGTTLFRMAMNSGMKITERRNHSLAITYYNDPRNGQPGTDATIYDPAPDFRFLNDTANYVLLQTSMNEKTGELKFTLWGTDDGRNGSYTKPLVSKRLPAGPTRITETTELPVGKKECQHAYPGAVASFTYTRRLADGTVEDQVFDSYYRPLPEICIVGVEKLTLPDETVADAIPVVSSTLQ